MGVNSVHGQAGTVHREAFSSPSAAPRARLNPATPPEIRAAATGEKPSEERQRAAGAFDNMPPALPSRPRLRVDAATKTVVAQIVDNDNHVIRQNPPTTSKHIFLRFQESEGLLFNEQV